MVFGPIQSSIRFPTTGTVPIGVYLGLPAVSSEMAGGMDQVTLFITLSVETSHCVAQ